MLKGYIEIERIRLRACHGVMPQERRVGNIFEVSVTVCYDMERAAATDDVNCAIDYSRVTQIVVEEMQIPADLLETVVARIRERIIETFPQVLSGSVKVTKITPPIAVALSSVSVMTRW